MLAREQASNALPAVDRWQETYAVAAEVVMQHRVSRVCPDDADSAVVVAHQPMPLEVVGKARWSCGLGEWANFLVHLAEQGPGKAAVGTRCGAGPAAVTLPRPRGLVIAKGSNCRVTWRDREQPFPRGRMQSGYYATPRSTL